MEKMVGLAVRTAEAEEESAKKMKAPPPPAAAARKKKTKKVLRTVPPEHVAFVLAKEPTPLARLSPEMQSRPISEECRRQSARVKELIRANHELLRSIQDHYRHELDTKGYVQVQVEVSDDDEF